MMGRKRRKAPKKLAGKLREIRLRMGLTQEDLAKQLKLIQDRSRGLRLASASLHCWKSSRTHDWLES